jgi:hypothetical protein
MRIDLIKDEKNNVIGYDIVKETEQDTDTINIK